MLGCKIFQVKLFKIIFRIIVKGDTVQKKSLWGDDKNIATDPTKLTLKSISIIATIFQSILFLYKVFLAGSINANWYFF